MQYQITVETQYVSWEDPVTHTISNEMYPTLVYQCASTTFKGNVPNQLGKVYVEIECSSLVRDVIHLDTELKVVGERLLDEGIVPPLTLALANT